MVCIALLPNRKKKLPPVNPFRARISFYIFQSFIFLLLFSVVIYTYALKSNCLLPFVEIYIFTASILSQRSPAPFIIKRVKRYSGHEGEFQAKQSSNKHFLEIEAVTYFLFFQREKKKFKCPILFLGRNLNLERVVKQGICIDSCHTTLSLLCFI